MFSKVTIASIFLFLWLRWLIATLPGYIHPDEFFQNAEITSSRIFDIESFIPWEYKAEHAIRSVIPPFLTTGIPFWILKNWLPENQLPTTVSLFAAERLGAFAWSLVIDFYTYRMCKHLSIKPIIPMILLATSQVTLAYHTRPFSNSFESVLLCVSLLTYVKFSEKATNKLAFRLGMVFSLGIFTRITFPLYALPIGIALIYQAYKQSDNINQFTAFIFSLTFGFVSFSALNIIVDSVFYGTLSFTVNGQSFKNVSHVFTTLFNPTSLASVRSYGDIVITPINNFLYNSKVENLAQHGLHPRFTHFAVNFPLLFGPLAIFGLLYIPNALSKIAKSPNAHVFYVLLGVLLSGLVGLSIIPHQEARFLCPLLVPLILIYTWRENQYSISVYFWLLWIVFNIVTTYIFGVVHQGGVIPAVGFLQRQTTGLHDCHLVSTGDLACTVGETNIETVEYSEFSTTTNMIFYKTYMPPQHLLTTPKESKSHHVRVLDFSSNLEDAVAEMVNRPGVTLRHTKTTMEVDFAKSSDTEFERTLLVIPGFVPLPKVEGHRYLLMATFGPHLSFDDMDKVMENASADSSLSVGQTNLNVFLLLSEKNDTGE